MRRLGARIDIMTESAGLWEPDPVLSPACHQGLAEASLRGVAPIPWLINLDLRLMRAEPVASLELCVTVCSILDDLARDEAAQDRPTEASYWADIRQRTMARAWSRAKAQLGAP